jgi:hypothetical protein
MGTGTGVRSECGSGEVLDGVGVYAGVRVSLILRYEDASEMVARFGSLRLGGRG